MHDRASFDRVLACLAARHVYEGRLWRYALLHRDPHRGAEWLRHQESLLHAAGPVPGSDPVARGWYEHLEYAPLVNARAHRLGARRRILNDGLAAQYAAFLDVVAHRARPSAEDRLAAAHYLVCMDRVDDAADVLQGVQPGSAEAALQHDYLVAYVACLRGDLERARSLAEPWLAHPVDRWRRRGVALAAAIDEARAASVGAAPSPVIDPDSRAERMVEGASRQATLELSATGNALTLQHHNVTSCELRFFRMDIELLFSRQPFVQGDVRRFSFIEPGLVLDVALSPEGRTSVAVPEALRGANLVVEAVAPGVRASIAHYAHDLGVQLAHAYGQLRVVRASSQAPLPATYVKVYGRQAGGAVAFYKDGYTDLGGRFDYATLSTDDLDRVEASHPRRLGRRGRDDRRLPPRPARARRGALMENAASLQGQRRPTPLRPRPPRLSGPRRVRRRGDGRHLP